MLQAGQRYFAASLLQVMQGDEVAGDGKRRDEEVSSVVAVAACLLAMSVFLAIVKLLQAPYGA